MSVIHVALASDKGYSRPLATTLASILANAGTGDSFFFHIIDLGLSGECRERIESLRAIREFGLHYLTLPGSRLEEALGTSLEEANARYGYSGAVFSRVFLPELLPDLPRVLYLDCDLLVLGSLKPLWDTQLEGKYAAWARDALEYLRQIQEDVAAFVASLGIGKDGVYCNSGVMLLNLEKAREECMQVRFFLLLRQLSQAVRTADQDVFNILFQGNCLVVPSMWNFQDPMSRWSPDFTFASPRFTPKIIHYTTAGKPWKKGNGCVNGELYRQYAEMAGWDLG